MALATEATLDMRAYKLTSSLLTFCLLGGCVLTSIDPDEIDVADEIGGTADEAGADDVGTGDATGTEGGTTDDAGMEATTGTDTNDTSDGQDTTDESDTISSEGSSDATTGGACEGVPTDHECSACLVEECCGPLLACLADPVCSCFYECFILGDNPDCNDECGAMNDVFVDLAECTVGSTCGACG